MTSLIGVFQGESNLDGWIVGVSEAGRENQPADIPAASETVTGEQF